MPKGNDSRYDAVFIRKSSAVQDDQGQRDNVQAMRKGPRRVRLR